jgi:hypothetical protein
MESIQASGDTEVIVWSPQAGPQHVLFDCPSPEIFFGGARGGGKTDGVLGKWAKKERLFGPSFNAMMFRRTTVSSTDAIDRSKDIFGPLGGKFNEGKYTWRMPNGGRVGFGYLDSVDDAQEYQGRNLTDAWIEEAGQYPTPAPIFRLFGALRGGPNVQMILTGNPGGPGQSWIRERYEMVPFPERPRILAKELPDKSMHHVAVIPSRLSDNRILLAADPGYASRLQLVGNAALVKAWLAGDWNAIEGAFFSEWDERRHVIQPFTVPKDWARFRAFDWGSASPFSVGWYAVASDDHRLDDGRVIPRGALVRYREWYGAEKNGETWIGLKLPNEKIGAGIVEREKGETVSYGVMDPSCRKHEGGPSIYQQMQDGAPGKLFFDPADNSRVSGKGAVSGWSAVRTRLVGDGDGRPMLFVFSTCRSLIRTLPLLEHDKTRAEDVDTSMEDHAADELRYACLSRPWVKPAAIQPAKNLSGYVPANLRGGDKPMSSMDY